MEIRIQSIHFDAAEKLEQFVQKKVSKLERYHGEIATAEVSLKITKPETAQNKEVAIKLTIPRGESLFSCKTADTFEDAVDQAVEVLTRQLVKSKEKIREK